MGKGRPRAVEKGILPQSSPVSPSGSLDIPLAPVYYPTEEEFKDPLEFIYRIRSEAKPYGICKVVPPKSWKAPFALDLDKFAFPTKRQAIHQLQVRPPSCDPKTFELEYDRFLEEHCGRKSKKKIVFEGEDLDLCKLFNAVKRYGGYKKVVKEKKWGEVSRFVHSRSKISGCAKHVLSQLYCEHLADYEDFCSPLNREKKVKSLKGGMIPIFLRVKLLNKAGETPSLEPPEDEIIRTLYMVGLDFRVSKQDLRDNFCAYGEIESVKMVTQHACAFVT